MLNASHVASHGLAATSLIGVISATMHYLPALSLVLSTIAATLSIVITVAGFVAKWSQGRAKIRAAEIVADAKVAAQALQSATEAASTVEQQAQIVQAAVDTLAKRP
jgi:hypothetical protein